MKTNLLLLSLFVIGLMLVTSCEKDKDADPDNEQELITTVRLTFTGGGATLTFNAADKDGAGGLAPVIDQVVLKPNTDYTLSVQFLDESKTPAGDITKEVAEESDEHLVCYAASGAMPLPGITDKDKKDKPLGLKSSFKTGAAGVGSLKVTLKHEADKNNATPCNTGETDAEATFPVSVN
jgi:hypothetical protein